MDCSLPTTLGLCAGVGMLELGVDIAIGGSRAVGYVERDSFAAAILLERMEDAALEPAPIWAGDLATFPWRDFRDVVDIVTAGFPCQPHSVAGARAGVEDERWIWPEIMAGIRVLRPGIVVLENVSGIRSSGGLAPVLGDLAEGGFRVAWTSLRASDVGASHQRERVFIVGVDDAALRGFGVLRGEGAAGRERHAHGADALLADDDGGRLREHGRGELLNGLRPACGDDADGCDPALAYPDGVQPEQHAGQRARPSEEKSGRTLREPAGLRDADHVGDPSRQRPQGLADGTDAPGREVSSGPTGPTGPTGRDVFAPGPTDRRWPRIVADYPDLAPAVEPGLRVVVDGISYVVDEHRADRLRAIGNGVVALQAAVAVRHLLRTLGFVE